MNGFGGYDYFGNPVYKQPAGLLYASSQVEALPQALSPDSPMLNPFTSASAGVNGGQDNNMGGNALQSLLNRNNQKASDALYGGLMNYAPQQMQVGTANAGGAKNADISGLLSDLGGFGAREWMK